MLREQQSPEHFFRQYFVFGFIAFTQLKVVNRSAELTYRHPLPTLLHRGRYKVLPGCTPNLMTPAPLASLSVTCSWAYAFSEHAQT